MCPGGCYTPEHDCCRLEEIEEEIDDDIIAQKLVSSLYAYNISYTLYVRCTIIYIIYNM